MNTLTESNKSDKNYLTTGLLSIFLGIFGAHRFYLGKVGSGLGQLFTFGGLGIWAFVDVLMILFGTVKDGKGCVVAKDPKAAKILYGVFGFVILLAIVSPKHKGGSSGASSSSSASWSPTKSNVTGLYYYSRGAGTMDSGTIEFRHGGSYILKDIMMSNGTSRGNWTLDGDTVKLFLDGQNVGTGTFSENEVELGSRTYKKQ